MYPSCSAWETLRFRLLSSTQKGAVGHPLDACGSEGQCSAQCMATGQGIKCRSDCSTHQERPVRCGGWHHVRRQACHGWCEERGHVRSGRAELGCLPGRAEACGYPCLLGSVEVRVATWWLLIGARYSPALPGRGVQPPLTRTGCRELPPLQLWSEYSNRVAPELNNELKISRPQPSLLSLSYCPTPA